MITHDLRWSLARGNPLVPCSWQATSFAHGASRPRLHAVASRTTATTTPGPSACLTSGGGRRSQEKPPHTGQQSSFPGQTGATLRPVRAPRTQTRRGHQVAPWPSHDGPASASLEPLPVSGTALRADQSHAHLYIRNRYGAAGSFMALCRPLIAPAWLPGGCLLSPARPPPRTRARRETRCLSQCQDRGPWGQNRGR